MALTEVAIADFHVKLAEHGRWLTMGTPADGGQLRLIDCSISGLNVRNRSLCSAEIVRSRISNSIFEACDFSYSLLLESAFSSCRFLSCTFRKANLGYTDCSSLDFSGSDLTRSDFRNANLRGANLTRCNLSWAWLVDTDLRSAILDRVELEGARLIRTKIYNPRKYKLGSVRDATIEDVDPSPDASGSKNSGIEALRFLRINPDGD